MAKRGRPSKDDKDLPVLVDMAQRWVNSCRKSSVYSLAQPHAKARYLADIDVKTDPHRAKGKLLENGIESTSKRLQRKFIKLRDRDEGTILRIGAYLEMAGTRSVIGRNLLWLFWGIILPHKVEELRAGRSDLD
jgi:hypothetical protein